MLEGYTTEKDPAGEGVADIAMFARLAALYRYVALLRRFDQSNLTPQEKSRLDARRAVLANPQTWE
jgi:hypothetical protein